jgi:hypothetical protein
MLLLGPIVVCSFSILVLSFVLHRMEGSVTESTIFFPTKVYSDVGTPRRRIRPRTVNVAYLKVDLAFVCWRPLTYQGREIHGWRPFPSCRAHANSESRRTACVALLSPTSGCHLCACDTSLIHRQKKCGDIIASTHLTSRRHSCPFFLVAHPAPL